MLRSQHPGQFPAPEGYGGRQPRVAEARRYRVGEPLLAGRTRWNPDAHYSYGPEGHELILFGSPLTTEQVDAVARGRSQFALIVEPPLIILAFRFGEAQPWAEAPFVWHMAAEEDRTVPEREAHPEERALLWISLVDAEDGVIRAQRGVALSPTFTRDLHRAIRAQARSKFDPLACVRTVAGLCERHPRTDDRLVLADAWSAGNE